jgi:hypothetical protein
LLTAPIASGSTIKTFQFSGASLAACYAYLRHGARA